MNIKSKITDKSKEEISLLLRQERSPVVKERLTYISMYVNGINKRDKYLLKINVIIFSISI
jgi:hypothetical protein